MICAKCGRDTLLQAGHWGLSNLPTCPRCGCPLGRTVERDLQFEQLGRIEFSVTSPTLSRRMGVLRDVLMVTLPFLVGLSVGMVIAR